MSIKGQYLMFLGATLGLTLIACNSAAPEPSAPAIQFQNDSFDLGDIGWMSEQAEKSGVDLDVNGLRAIDRDVAFLFGDVRVAAGTIRSVLLRTRDGGNSWQEVMSPVPGSQLVHVAFSDPEHGWALAQWAVEGPGTILLFASRDEGETWRQLTEIQGSSGHAVPDGFPVSMTFTSSLNGVIELAFASESTSTDDSSEEIETLTSDDGGVTWSLARRATRHWSPAETPSTRHDRGYDGTDWELESHAAGDRISIRRFDREKNQWRVTTLPTHFQYERGRVLTSP